MPVEQSPNHGYCAAQKTHYFAYKLHAVCTASGVFKAFDITQASVHDIQYLNDVKTQFSNCVLIGDRGYLSRQYQQDLFDDNSIELVGRFSIGAYWQGSLLDAGVFENHVIKCN